MVSKLPHKLNDEFGGSCEVVTAHRFKCAGREKLERVQYSDSINLCTEIPPMLE